MLKKIAFIFLGLNLITAPIMATAETEERSTLSKVLFYGGIGVVIIAAAPFVPVVGPVVGPVIIGTAKAAATKVAVAKAALAVHGVTVGGSTTIGSTVATAKAASLGAGAIGVGVGTATVVVIGHVSPGISHQSSTEHPKSWKEVAKESGAKALVYADEAGKVVDQFKSIKEQASLVRPLFYQTVEEKLNAERAEMAQDISDVRSKLEKCLTTHSQANQDIPAECTEVILRYQSLQTTYQNMTQELSAMRKGC